MPADNSESFDNRRQGKSLDASAAKSAELRAAANGLVEWFNTMEISKEDAETIMSRVMAKLIVGRTRKDVFALSEAVNDAAFRLVNDMNARLHQDSKLDWKRRNG